MTVNLFENANLSLHEIVEIMRDSLNSSSKINIAGSVNNSLMKSHNKDFNLFENNCRNILNLWITRRSKLV